MALKKQANGRRAAGTKASTGRSNKSRYDRGADARRRYIIDRVRRYGRVTYQEIEETGKQKAEAGKEKFPTGYQSFLDDDEFFAAYDLPPKLVPGQGVFVLRYPDVGWTFQYRLEENSPQKRAVGMLAAAMLLGRPGKDSKDSNVPFDADTPRDKLEELQATIWKQLMGEKERDASKRVRSYLGQYWRKRHRLVAMDAGTTTHAVAEYVANPWGIEEEDEKGLPPAGVLSPNRDSFDPRSISLRVLTNCPRIERCMESPRCFPSVISIGGALRKDTVARTGVLAEQSMKAMNLRPDIAMLGTTSLRTEDGYSLMGFACDSEEEARTKSLFEADLRCILMDSSKCQRYRSSAFTFAVCGSKSVDVVITDSGIWDVANKEGIDIDRLLWDAGVALLVADAPPRDSAS